MLKPKKPPFGSSRSFFNLLLFISVVTFQTSASANTKLDQAKQYRQLGYEEQQKGNFDAALTYYSKAVSLGFENPMLLNDMGIIYEQYGLVDRAESLYLKAIQRNSKYLPSYTNLAYLYLAQGNQPKAIEYLRKRVELSPHDEWGRKAKEELFKLDPRIKQRDFQKQVEALDKEVVLKNQQEFYDRINKGRQLFQLGRDLQNKQYYQEAIQKYDQALTYLPRDSRILEAKKQAALEITKNNIKQRSDQAIKYLESGDPYSAEQEIQRMLTHIPDEHKQ